MCGNQLLGTLPHTGKAEVTYLGGQAGPLLTETLNSYESVDQASAVLNAARAAVKSCPKFDQTDKDGTVTHYTAAPLSFDKLADDQYAARLSFESTVGSGTADVFVAQRQNVIVFTGGVSVVSILGPGQIQPGDFLRFTTSAVTRVDEAS